MIPFFRERAGDPDGFRSPVLGLIGSRCTTDFQSVGVRPSS
jgi:hypothetical protein